MNSLQVEPVYINTDLMAQPRQVFRIDNYGPGRYYYTLDEVGTPTFYVSVTTMIKQNLPAGEFLIKWIASKGWDKSRDYMKERAVYGTFTHIMFHYLLLNSFLDLDELDEHYDGYLNELPEEARRHYYSTVTQSRESILEEARKDLLSFSKFLVDHKVKPIAIEPVLTSSQGYAGALDLFCEMTVMVPGLDADNPYKTGPRKGMAREVKVPLTIKGIVDYKSGKKGFYDEHALQLELLRRLLQENLGEEFISYTPIHLFNFAPKAWITNIDYHLKDQTENPVLEKADPIIRLAEIAAKSLNSKKLHISGQIDLNAMYEGKQDPQDLCQMVDVYELIKTGKLIPEKGKNG